jgi:hypothetical protein
VRQQRHCARASPAIAARRDRMYGELLSRAESLLALGESVVLDASCGRSLMPPVVSAKGPWTFRHRHFGSIAPTPSPR